jgi:short-subunit dehydrogenase
MKNIVIIGASHGIGRSLAFEFAKEKNNLFLAARDFEALTAIKKELQTNVEVFALDVVDEKNVREVLDKILQIDLFIYCAGTYEPMPVTAIDLKKAKLINEVNFVGALNCLDVVIKKMLLKKSGQIALVASVAGYVGLPKSFAYGASKAALINLAETLYAELAAFNIKVSVINPGFVKTRLTDKNNFKMPAMISSDEAAEYIIQGLRENKFEIHFPKKFTMWLKFLRILPYSILLFFTKKIAAKG